MCEISSVMFERLFFVVLVVVCWFSPSPNKIITALRNAKEIKKGIDDLKGGK